MPQINATVHDNFIKKLREIADTEDQSFSKTVCEIIELGLKFYREKQRYLENSTLSEDQKEPDKTKEYLLRILNVCHEIFRFTYDSEESRYEGCDDPNEILEFIKKRIQERAGTIVES